MPFDYYHPKIPEDFREKIKNRFYEMHYTEMRERAKLYFNLRFPRNKAIKRIKQNIEWDFELSVIPPFYNDVEKIVEEVYKYLQRT